MKRQEEHVFVKSMECTELLDKIDIMLESVYLRCSTSDEDDYSEIKGGEHDVPNVCEWCGIEPFSYTAERVSVAREN